MSFWDKKRGFFLDNLLGPLGNKNALFSPNWIKKHPQESLAAAAVAAAAFTGGSSLGLLGAGAGAAGAGAAGAGAAAAGTGAGLLGGGTAAGLLGAGAEAGLASSLMGAGAMTPMFTGGAAGLGALGGAEGLAAAGGLSAFGPTASGLGSMAALDGSGAGLTASIWDGVNASKIHDAFGKAQKAQSLMGGQQKQPVQPAPMPRAPQMASTNEALERLKKLYGGMYD